MEDEVGSGGKIAQGRIIPDDEVHIGTAHEMPESTFRTRRLSSGEVHDAGRAESSERIQSGCDIRQVAAQHAGCPGYQDGRAGQSVDRCSQSTNNVRYVALDDRESRLTGRSDHVEPPSSGSMGAGVGTASMWSTRRAVGGLAINPWAARTISAAT